MANTVTHFEIYGDNLPELADFYRSLFGWNINKAPGIDYHMIQTGANGAAGIRGGLQHRPIPEPRSWVHYVSVDSIDETLSSRWSAWAARCCGPRPRCRRRPGTRWSRIRRGTSSRSGRPT